MSHDEFVALFKAEFIHWKRLSMDQEGLLLAFAACLGERLSGKDPADLLPRRKCELTEGGE